MIANYTALPIAIIAFWEIAVTQRWFSPAILPSPEAVLYTFFEQLRNGELQADLTISLSRVLQGYSLAAVAGILLGILMGASVVINRFFTLVMNAIRQIPSMAWIPLIILWFGIGELSKVVIIFKAAFFPILISTIDGMQNTPRQYLEVAKICKMSKLDTFRLFYIPSALSSIFVGLRLGLGMAWMTMVAAELIAASSGIGYRINDGRELAQPDLVIVGMIVIGVIGVAMDAVLKAAARRLLHWQGE